MATILVVDDDPAFTDTCRTVLENAGYTVVTASNPVDGKRVLAQQPPALLILDVKMTSPDDGIVMAQELRRTGSQIPILMLTTLSKVSSLGFARDRDMIPLNEFVEKPISPKQLTDLVGHMLTVKQ